MVGDIIIAPYPYTDLTVYKTRPTLVVADVRMGGMPDWLLCEITSHVQRHAQDIPITGADMQSGRLAVASCVRINRLATLDEGVFHRTIGRLTDAKMAEILAAVRAIF